MYTIQQHHASVKQYKIKSYYVSYNNAFKLSKNVYHETKNK